MMIMPLGQKSIEKEKVKKTHRKKERDWTGEPEER